MTIAFILLMRRYTSICRFAACVNFTLIFLICDLTLIVEGIYS